MINWTAGNWRRPHAQGKLVRKEKDPTTTWQDGHFSLLLDHSDWVISSWIHCTTLTWSTSMYNEVGWDTDKHSLNIFTELSLSLDNGELWAFIASTPSSGDTNTLLHFRHLMSMVVIQIARWLTPKTMYTTAWREEVNNTSWFWRSGIRTFGVRAEFRFKDSFRYSSAKYCGWCRHL